MKVLLNWIKGKLSGIAIVALATMLTLVSLQNKTLEDELVPLRENYALEVERSNRLLSENENLRISLEQRPNQYIKVEKEICSTIVKGEVAEERILNAPATKKKVESDNEKAYADIDAPFDPDFQRLLDEG